MVLNGWWARVGGVGVVRLGGRVWGWAVGAGRLRSSRGRGGGQRDRQGGATGHERRDGRRRGGGGEGGVARVSRVSRGRPLRRMSLAAIPGSSHWQEDGKMVALRQMIQKGIKPPVLIFVQSKERAVQLFHQVPAAAATSSFSTLTLPHSSNSTSTHALHTPAVSPPLLSPPIPTTARSTNQRQCRPPRMTVGYPRRHHAPPPHGRACAARARGP